MEEEKNNEIHTDEDHMKDDEEIDGKLYLYDNKLNKKFIKLMN